jgi:hypothetical protein
MTDEQIQMLRYLIKSEIDCAQIDGMEHGAWGWAEKQLDEGWKKLQESFTTENIEEKMTDTRKLELLLTELKSTAKRKTCYDGKGGGDYYEYSEDQDVIFDDGDRYGRITFARELLESVGESYE